MPRRGGAGILVWLLGCWLGLALGLGAGLAQPALQVFPDEAYRASGLVRGRYEPTRKVYTLTNTSESALAWSTLKSEPWFSVSEPSGALGAGGSTNVLVFPNSLALDLGPGLYVGSLTFLVVGTGKAWTGEVGLEIGLGGPGLVESTYLTVSNRLDLLLFGDVGAVYSLETSEDLAVWVPAGTNVFSSGVERVAIDLGAEERLFYRASSPDPDRPIQLAITNAVVENLEQLRLLGDPWGIYLVETSADGADWAPVFTNKLPLSGSVLFTNAFGNGQSGTSYRVTTLGIFPLETLHHIMIVGQSLGVGIWGSPVLSTTPSQFHYRFFSDGTQTSFTRLVETGLETIASGAGNHLTATAPGHRLLFSNTAVPGAYYRELKKGTEPYAQGVTQFRDGPQATAEALFGYQPSAIFAVHGEGDHNNPEYDLNIRDWQQDFEADIRNVTGLDAPVPMFHSQASAWTRTGVGSGMTLGAFKVLEESERHPDRTILVCPKYFFPYSDGIHLTNTSYRWLGEYYAKAYRATVLEGHPWVPLKPGQITRSNTVITATFHVPVPPLVLDTNLVLDPGNFGFSYTDGTDSPPTIETVELAGPETVRVTLSAEPAGTGERLRYAFSGIPGSPGGPQTGPRGNLRDSDPEASLYGNPLFNWCVHFDKPVEVEPLNP